MASAFQQSSTRRKVMYLALIVVIYVVNTFFWRGVASPLTGGVAPPWTMTAQANELELREQGQGDPDLVGSTVSLALTGSRGLAITVLWNAAIDRQMRHEWNELELLVRLLTKLQPHFLTPWLFQSWNLSYNVSVESDRVKDKYFYISRGIELLAQGERVNRDNPDMRFWIGFYYINKFGSSDEKNTLRSLLQLSAIDPAKRDPNLLRTASGSGRRRTINMAAFEQFCRDNPQLVRRLRQSVPGCGTPDGIVDFLADNRKVPTRYVDPESDAGLFRGRPGELKPASEQFPILPNHRSRLFPDEPTASAVLGDSFCNFQFGRVWFAHSLDPLPAPEIMTEIKTRAERLAEPANRGKRIPRSPAEIIYRNHPARAQSYVAERLEQEGWFDETGWAVDAGQSGRSRWFEEDVVIGGGEPIASNAWARAYDMWREYGVANGIILDPPTEVERLSELARRFREKYRIPLDDPALGIQASTLDPEMASGLRAHRQLFFMQQNRQLTNFTHHYVRAFAEQDRDAVEARKLMHEAERLRNKLNEPDRAIDAYRKAFELWIKVLSNPQYKDFRNDTFILEETYETQLKYVDLLRQRLGPQLRPILMVGDLLGIGAQDSGGLGLPGTMPSGLLYMAVTDARLLPVPITGPMEGDDPTGTPWFPPSVIQEVRGRLRLDAPSAPPPSGKPPEPVDPNKVTPGG
jgi:hypothetical protein